MHLSLHRPSPPPPTPSKGVLILFIGYEKNTRLKEDFDTLFFFKKIKFEKIHNRQPPGTGSITVNS